MCGVNQKCERSQFYPDREIIRQQLKGGNDQDILLSFY